MQLQFCCSENTSDQVDWQSLVNGVGGHELLEWQARAVGGFKTEAAQQEVLVEMCFEVIFV